MPRRIRSSVFTPFSAPFSAPSSTPCGRPPRLQATALAVALTLAQAGGHAHAAAAEVDAVAETAMPMVTINGSNSDSARYAAGGASASKLDISLRDTPQSISQISRARMDDFKLNSVNDVLAATTGVTVEKVETDRTYYTARGFDIVNFQYDGVGIPFVFGNVMGDLDTAIYERIDVVRGANGLSASTGNPSATVNYLRKRPTAQLQASAELSAGSWGKRRAEADVSAPLNASASVKGRAVLVRQQADSHLDRYHSEKTVGYAIVEAKLAADTVLNIGHISQDNKTRGGMWGALPLYYKDGSRTDYAAGTNTSADWSRWDTRNNTSFVELNQGLGGDWNLKSTLSHSNMASRGKMFYVYGVPDKASGGGLFSYPSIYRADNRQTVLDVNASGKVALGGRQHEVSVGASWSRSRLNDSSLYGRGMNTPLSRADDFTGAYPEPLFDAGSDGSQYEDKRKTVYAAVRLNLADQLKLLAGFNSTRADSSGTAYGVSAYKAASKTTPYLGAVVDLTSNLSGYASYTKIFNPQSEIDSHGQPLAPVMGSNAELGLKADLLDHKLSATAAVFRVKQNNSAEQAGMVNGRNYYRGINAESSGVELELSGQLAKGWTASAGLTRLSIKDSAGQATRVYVPRTLLRSSTSYRLATLPALKVGASLNWQSEARRAPEEGFVARQAAYAVLGLMANYEIGNNVSVALNLDNLTDKKYLSSLYWNQAYYAAPRSASISVKWTY